MTVKRINAANGEFYADIKVLSNLELLDLSISEKDSQSYIVATEVAASVIDWNGRGKVNPLWLIGNREHHKYIHLVVRFLDQERGELPKLEVEEGSDCLILRDNDDFTIKVKQLTVLELMDVIANSRGKSGDVSLSEMKCKITSSIVTDWNGKGKLSPEELRANRQYHPYVITVEESLNKFFLSEQFTVSEPTGLLDNSDNNGRNDHTESGAVESSKTTDKRFSFDVERVPSSQKS